jgi:hypothetical protein
VVSFVNPANASQYRPVSFIKFDNPVDVGDILHVEVYDADDTLIGTYDSTLGSPETVVFDLGGPVGAYMIVDDRFETAYTVDEIIVLDEPPVFIDGFESGNTDRWSEAVAFTVD